MRRVTRRWSRFPKLFSFGTVAIQVEWLLFDLEWWCGGQSGGERTESSLSFLSGGDDVQSSVKIVEADNFFLVIRVGGGYFIVVYFYE